MRRLYLKGLTLSALAYGDAFLKASVDIDLLVDPNDIPAAAAILRELGFAVVDPAHLKDNGLARWHRRHKESAWFRDRDCLTIDLHSRLADSPAILPLIVDAVSQQVAVSPTLSLSTLADANLLAYLAVHGASSCWFRLKWIADFAALLSRKGACPSAEDRSIAQALLLCDALFEIGLAADQREAMLADPTLRRMLDLALGALAAGEPTERRFGTIPIHLNQMLMKPGPRFAAAEVWRQISRAVSTRLVR